MQEGEDSNNN